MLSPIAPLPSGRSHGDLLPMPNSAAAPGVPFRRFGLLPVSQGVPSAGYSSAPRLYQPFSLLQYSISFRRCPVLFCILFKKSKFSGSYLPSLRRNAIYFSLFPKKSAVPLGDGALPCRQRAGGTSFYSMMLLPVISAGCARPMILSMVGAMSASRPPSRSLASLTP